MGMISGIAKKYLINKIKDLIFGKSGKGLKAWLGISKFNQSYIQRVINSPINIFIITVDSKYPERFITYSRLKNSKVNDMVKVKANWKEKGFDDLRLTPPILLEEFKDIIPANSLLIRRDLCGEYYMNDELYDF